MNSTAYICGFIVGVLFVAVAGLILRHVFIKKTGAAACEYDERQIAVRGQAYKLAYMTMLVCAVLGGLAELAVGHALTTVFPFAMICVWVSVCVYATFCITKDAYTTRATKPVALGLVFLAAGVVNVIIFFIEGAKLIENGLLSMSFINLLSGAATLYLGAILFIKTGRDRREGAE